MQYRVGNNIRQTERETIQDRQRVKQTRQRGKQYNTEWETISDRQRGKQYNTEWETI